MRWCIMSLGSIGGVIKRIKLAYLHTIHNVAAYQLNCTHQLITMKRLTIDIKPVVAGDRYSEALHPLDVRRDCDGPRLDKLSCKVGACGGR